MREIRDPEAGLLGEEPVVVIDEPTGWHWEIVVDAGSITDLRMSGKVIDGRALTSVPLADLARMSTAYIARVQAQIDDGLHLWEAFLLSDLQPGQVRLDGDSPRMEDFAKSWHNTPSVAPDGTTRRDALAEHYCVTVWAIDKWVKQARRLDLIPPATTGRGNKRTEATNVARDN